MQIRLFAPSCGDNQSLFQALVVMNLVQASKRGNEKKLNDIGGTHKVNGEFSGPDYTHNLSHLFFRLYFLSSFLSSYFSPFQASASSQGFSFRDHWSRSNGVSQPPVPPINHPEVIFMTSSRSIRKIFY